MDIHKNKIIDILFIIFIIGLSIYYNYYISRIQAPGWDGSVYLINARNWLNNVPLFETFRSPLLSWLIAGIWYFTGEDWIIVKMLQSIFTISAGILLYIIIKKHKGSLFSFGVVALTMLNTQVFFISTDILTEGLSLFFLIFTLYFLESPKENHWFFAGICIGLTFASRYPIVIQAIAIFLTVFLIRKKDWKLFIKVIYGVIPTMTLIILIIFLKTGMFQTAVEGDVNFNILLSPYYLLNSIKIWGPVILLFPLAFLFKRIYYDKFNYIFIAWFLVSFTFWSAWAGDSGHQYRFTIQFTPAIYYLVILGIENIAKTKNIYWEIRDLSKSFIDVINLLNKFLLFESEKNKTKIIFGMLIIFWSILIINSPPYIISLVNSIDTQTTHTEDPIPSYQYYKYLEYSINTSVSEDCTINMPNSPTLILRIDDVQAYAWNKAVIRLVDALLNKNMSTTLGVIPKDIDKDPIIDQYILEKIPKIEVAMHGVNHEDNEYLNLSEEETYNLTKQGMEKIKSAFGLYPVTFIPPNNEYSQNTTKVLSRLGFKIFSGKLEIYKFEEKLFHIGYTTPTRYLQEKELVPINEILNRCKMSLEEKNMCVILIHPQDYMKNDMKTLDEDKYNEFIRLLDDLKKINARSSTFKDLVICKKGSNI